MQSFSDSSLPSIRSKTAKLVLACMLPTLIAFAALTYDQDQRDNAANGRRQRVLRVRRRPAQARRCRP